jgi:hypothetical protein
VPLVSLLLTAATRVERRTRWKEDNSWWVLTAVKRVVAVLYRKSYRFSHAWWTWKIGRRRGRRRRKKCKRQEKRKGKYPRVLLPTYKESTVESLTATSSVKHQFSVLMT